MSIYNPSSSPSSNCVHSQVIIITIITLCPSTVDHHHCHQTVCISSVCRIENGPPWFLLGIVFEFLIVLRWNWDIRGCDCSLVMREAYWNIFPSSPPLSWKPSRPPPCPPPCPPPRPVIEIFIPRRPIPRPALPLGEKDNACSILGSSNPQMFNQSGHIISQIQTSNASGIQIQDFTE